MSKDLFETGGNFNFNAEAMPFTCQHKCDPPNLQYNIKTDR